MRAVRPRYLILKVLRRTVAFKAARRHANSDVNKSHKVRAACFYRRRFLPFPPFCSPTFLVYHLRTLSLGSSCLRYYGRIAKLCVLRRVTLLLWATKNIKIFRTRNSRMYLVFCDCIPVNKCTVVMIYSVKLLTRNNYTPARLNSTHSNKCTLNNIINFRVQCFRETYNPVGIQQYQAQ